MPFPDSPRVLYAKSPLVEVICQLRFPTILRIDASPPAELQDELRVDYPELIEGREAGISIQLTKDGPVLSPPAAQTNANYAFQSANGDWTVNLTRDFVALTARRYSRWEHFKERLDKVVASFERIYKPAYYTRLGLRYRDVIQRSKLGIQQDTPWSALLAKHIAGELSDAQVGVAIQEVQKQIVVALDRGMVTIRHGLITESNAADEKEQCYVVDADFFDSTRTEVHDGSATLEGFNRNARKLWRWTISDRLHNELDPKPVA